MESVDENRPSHPKPGVLNKDRLGSEVGGREGQSSLAHFEDPVNRCQIGGGHGLVAKLVGPIKSATMAR